MAILRKEGDEWKPIDLEEHKSEGDPRDLVIDPRLVKIFDKVKKRLKNDYDFMFIIDGDVGVGKSNLGRVCARYISDERFHPRKHMIKSVDDIERVLSPAKKGDAIIFDEGSGIFSSTDTLTKKTKHAQYVLDVCRQKNLAIIVVCPYFKRLTSYVAVDRSSMLLRAYTRPSENHKRGRFQFFDKKTKERLYIEERKPHGTQKYIESNWRGVVGEDKNNKEDYIRFKNETLREALSQYSNKKKELTPHQIQRNYKLEIVKNNKDMDSNTLAKLLNVNVRSIHRYRNLIKEQNVTNFTT